MKRTLPLILLIAAVVSLVPLLAVFGEPPNPTPCERHGYYPAGGSTMYGAPCCTSCPAPSTTKSTSENDKVIAELTSILNQTKSAETFLVTAAVLGRMGPDAKSSLPVIIRNAERLELFDDLYKANAAAENRAAAQEIIAALEMILDKKASAKARIWGNANTPVCYPAAAPVPVFAAPSQPLVPTSYLVPPPPSADSAAPRPIAPSTLPGPS